MDEESLPRYRALSRLKRTGGMLLRGPRALFPPAGPDDLGWLEPVLTIVLSRSGVFPNECIIVFCDNTLNRDSGFLEPMIRIARWNRVADVQAGATFPNVGLTLGRAKDWSQVQAVARSLQVAARTFGYCASGLPREREYPSLDRDCDRPFFRVSIDNGAQRIELASPSIAGDTFSGEVASACTALIDQVAEVDPAGWMERYDYDPTTEDRSSGWDRQLGAATT